MRIAWGGTMEDEAAAAMEDGGQQQRQRQRLAREMRLAATPPAASEYVSNVVRTSRYTLLNFLPKNLFEQLSEMSNFYFLCVGVLQAVPAISTTGGVPTMYLPLSFILAVSGTRAAVEDFQRHKTDREEGSRRYEALGPDGAFRPKASADLEVGEVVRVRKNQPFPADLLFVRSSNERGHCFVETASLDGETDLKPKVAVAHTHERLVAGEAYARVVDGADLEWEGPNKRLEDLRGYLTCGGGGGRVTLLGENLLLRGTVLKNTEHAVGVVLYTGDDTKIRQNVKTAKRLLKSTVMRMVDRFLVGMVAIQFVLCFVAATTAGSLYGREKDRGNFYLRPDDSPALEGFTRFFTWFIILSQLVPISLLVSSEIVKSLQAYFINRDVAIYDEATDTPALVRSSVINEDLGQVEYVFTDKTGTLTQNRMEFRVAVVAGGGGGNQTFGSTETEISRRVSARMAEVARRRAAAREAAAAGATPEEVEAAARAAAANDDAERPRWTDLVRGLDERRAAADGDQVVQFDARDEYLDRLWLGGGGGDASLRLYLLHMALSNTISPIFDDKEGRNVFQSSSPDELALCNFAKLMGFELVSRNPTRVRVSKQGRGEDEELVYEHLATLAFNSKRKRVTMVYRSVGGGRVLVMCKGADSSVLPLVAGAEEDADLRARLVSMATDGLRTLVVAHADLGEEWWNEWRPRFEEATSLPERGEEEKHSKGACSDRCRVCDALERMERAAGLGLVGATAIEDRLQDLVPEAIADFLRAGVKVWMLTGDKRETAKNIALACNLVDPDMENAREPAKSRLVEVTGSWARVLDSEAELGAMFRAFDSDGNGVIEHHELGALVELLGVPLGNTPEERRRELDRLFKFADSDGNGVIDLDEFVLLMRAGNVSLVEAVYADVQQGLATVARCGDDPVSMVIEGDAFAALYPSEAEGGALPPRWFRRRRRRRRRAKPEADATRQPREFDDAALARLRDDFFSLAVRCKSVVCCRLTPFQKAMIVREIKARQGVTTLAIGDGANDEAMILEADVGVGISGLEGTAAARAASFAIGQFRYLHTLMFVHGHWNYRRVSVLVPYIFYKGLLAVLGMYWFGLFSQFSGQQAYNDLLYLTYNVAQTALPVMVLAVFDRALRRDTCENEPLAYGAVLRGALFNPRVFWTWIGRSVLHSLLVFFVVFGSIGAGTADEDGRTHGLWFFTTTVYWAVVMVATFRIVLEFVSVTWLHHASIALSFCGFYVVAYLLNLICTGFNSTNCGVVERMFTTPTTWLTVLLASAVPLLVEFGVAAASAEFRPGLVQVLRERERGGGGGGLRAVGGGAGGVGGGEVEMEPLEEMEQPQLKVSDAQMRVLIRHIMLRHNLSGANFVQNSESSQISLVADRGTRVIEV